MPAATGRSWWRRYALFVGEPYRDGSGWDDPLGRYRSVAEAMAAFPGTRTVRVYPAQPARWEYEYPEHPEYVTSPLSTVNGPWWAATPPDDAPPRPEPHPKRGRAFWHPAVAEHRETSCTDYGDIVDLRHARRLLHFNEEGWTTLTSEEIQ